MRGKGEGGSTESFRRGTVQCVTRFGHRFFFWLRSFFPIFLSIVFCHTVSKNSVGEQLCFTKFLVSKVFMDKRGGRGEGGGGR